MTATEEHIVHSAIVPEEQRKGSGKRRRWDSAIVFAVVVMGVLIAAGVLGPLVWRKDPAGIALGESLQPPSWSHPMGTDGMGRDVFARFNQGARLSLLVALSVTVVGAIIGGLLGFAGGLWRGWTDTIFMRAMDALLAFPSLLLAMVVTMGLGRGIIPATVGITLASLPWYARLARSEVIRIRSLPYVEAVVVLGASRNRVVWRHILPHTIPTMLVMAGAVFGHAVLALAALSFIGLGAQIPTPEWGAMIADGFRHAITGNWWVGVFPGLGVLVAVTTSSLLVDRTRDILDPTGRHWRA